MNEIGHFLKFDYRFNDRCPEEDSFRSGRMIPHGEQLLRYKWVGVPDDNPVEGWWQIHFFPTCKRSAICKNFVQMLHWAFNYLATFFLPAIAKTVRQDAPVDQ